MTILTAAGTAVLVLLPGSLPWGPLMAGNLRSGVTLPWAGGADGDLLGRLATGIASVALVVATAAAFRTVRARRLRQSAGPNQA